MILRSRPAVLLTSISTLLMAACGSSNEQGAGGLVATTGVWADITSNVACGEAVEAVIPPGADPHTFEPSLRDRERLEAAELVVANGADLEDTMLDLLTTADATVVEVANHVDLLTDHDHDADDEAHDEEDGEGDEHGHGDGDPHFWLDPTRVAGAIDVIGSALVGRDPAGLRRCTDDYRAELVELDTEIAAMFAGLPADRRLLVTNHDSLAYFADRYGFDVVGTVLPGTSTIAETNPAELQALADEIVRRGVPAVFLEAAEPDAEARALADRVGVEVVPLLTGSLDDGPSSTYVGMMRTVATQIAEALAP